MDVKLFASLSSSSSRQGPSDAEVNNFASKVEKMEPFEVVNMDETDSHIKEAVTMPGDRSAGPSTEANLSPDTALRMVTTMTEQIIDIKLKFGYFIESGHPPVSYSNGTPSILRMFGSGQISLVPKDNLDREMPPYWILEPGSKLQWYHPLHNPIMLILKFRRSRNVEFSTAHLGFENIQDLCTVQNRLGYLVGKVV